MDRGLIDQYQSGGRLLAEAISGLTPAELRRVPSADASEQLGRWSIQQVVMHVADAELVYVDRIKRVITEPTPALRSFDPDGWVTLLRYDDQSADDAAALVQLVRRQTARMLAGQPDEVFARRGIHNEAGSVTVEEMIVQLTRHLEHHARFIAAKRQWMGK